jgi:hypothetical protein
MMSVILCVFKNTAWFYRTLLITTCIVNKLFYIKSDIIATRMDARRSTATEFREFAKYLLCALFRRCMICIFNCSWVDTRWQ